MWKNLYTKSKRINKDTLIVSADIGKTMHYGYARTPDGDELSVFTFSNSGAGYYKLYKTAETFMKSHNLKDMIVGIESTGVYGEPLACYLERQPNVKIVQVNPMHTKRVKELHGNSPNKTDKKDPKVIADIMQLGHMLSVIIPKAEAAHLRRLTTYRESKLVDLGRTYNRLEAHISLIFPEFLIIMKNIKLKTVKHLLLNYPTPGHIKELGEEQLQKVIHKVSRGQIGLDRAKELYKAASTSGGIKEGIESLLYIINEELSEIEHYEKKIEAIEDKIVNILHDISYAKYILSIKGIGPIITSVLIGETGDFNLYNNARELLKLSGLNLYEISSGKHQGERHITKRGRSLMRKVLYFAALNIVKESGIYHDKYQSYLKRGMKKNKALIAISRKLLGLIFSLVKNKVEYIENYEKLKKTAA